MVLEHFWVHYAHALGWTSGMIFVEHMYSKEMINSIIRRKMLVGSPLFEEWAKEERKEATEKARIATIRNFLVGQ